MGPREEAGLPPYWATGEGERDGQDRRKGWVQVAIFVGGIAGKPRQDRSAI